MRRLLPSIAAAVLIAGCDGQRTEEEQALNERGEHPEVLAAPAPGDAELREGAVTPGERGSIYNAADNPDAAVADGTTAPTGAQAAVGVVRRFGELLERRQFAEARRMYAEDGAASGLTDEQFAARFEDFETIDTAVEHPARIEGAAGSLYAQVQLTLTGELQSGEPYSRTGLVTLRRANEVPGASEEQLQWRILNVRLGVAPESAAGTRTG
jgi:hypothetical protein